MAIKHANPDSPYSQPTEAHIVRVGGKVVQEMFNDWYLVKTTKAISMQLTNYQCNPEVVIFVKQQKPANKKPRQEGIILQPIAKAVPYA